MGQMQVGSAAVYRELLVGNRRFRNLAGAMLTSSLGDWIGLFAILALTESLLGATRAGAFALSGIMVARVLPTLVLGPVAGVFVDRWDRKRTMIVTDVVRGVVMATIALTGDIFQLLVATFLIEVMSTLFIPALYAVQPNLVKREELVQANQLALMLTYGTLPLGAGLFALFVAVSGALLPDQGLLAGRPEAVAIWINALTFFVSAVFIARIRDVGPRRRSVQRDAESIGAFEELKQGLRFITGHPLIRALVMGVMGAFVAAGVVASGVGKLFATILNAGASGFGLLGFAVGAGLFGGLIATGPASQRLHKARLFAPGIGVAGVALVVTSLMPTLPLAMLTGFIMGAGAGVAFLTGYTLLQENASDEIRGRTFAAFNTGVRAALFASLVVGPVLVGVIGLEGRNPVTGTYPYSIAGVRITLVLAGVFAAGGAVWTGRAIHGALTHGRESIGLAVSEAASVTRDGLFVVFEGGEGAGKSTQLRLLRAAVERAGHDAVTTREPGGTEIGERIRDVLLDTSSVAMADRTEALLYAAARAQHADEIIRPALDKGAVVLCDRFVDSSIVYQGVARGLGDVPVSELNRWATTELTPDLTILLDIDAREGLRRAGTEPDRLEAAGADFHRTVNDGYRRRAASDPARYVVVDAMLPAEQIHARIRAAVLSALTARTDPDRAGPPDTPPDEPSS